MIFGEFYQGLNGTEKQQVIARGLNFRMREDSRLYSLRRNKDFSAVRLRNIKLLTSLLLNFGFDIGFEGQY